jgi:nucleotide-binding universal stress UspA family protein
MGTIVAGVDGSDESRAALGWAAEEADRRGDRLVVLHAWHVPSGAGPFSNEMAVLASGDVQAAAEHLVDTLVDKAREKAGDGVEVVGETVCGSPGAVLIARSGDASMIVVGSRGLGSVRGLLLGSVSRQVVQHAHCPVVVVPHAGRTREEPAA